MVGKTGVVGVMAEKLLSITAAAAAGLPAGLNYEKHTTTLTLERGASAEQGGIMWPLTPKPETRGTAALWPCLRYTPVKYRFSVCRVR